MSTRRSRGGLKECNQERESSDAKKTRPERSRRSTNVTEMSPCERVVRGKGSLRDRPKDQKEKLESQSSTAASSGASDVEPTPKKGRGRTRKSINSDTSVTPVKTPDKSQDVYSVEAKSELLSGQTDGSSKGRELPTTSRRTSCSAHQVEEASWSKPPHSDHEFNSRLKNTQSLEENGSLQKDFQNMSHRDKLNNSAGARHSESMESPSVRQRGRSRRSHHLNESGLSDGFSPTNQINSSNEKATCSCTTESDCRLGQPSEINQDNCLDRKQAKSEHSSETMKQTPRKRSHDSMVDIPLVTNHGRKKRGRPRKNQTHDGGLESSTHDVPCSSDKEHSSETMKQTPRKISHDSMVDIPLVTNHGRKKRGRPRKNQTHDGGLESSTHDVPCSSDKERGLSDMVGPLMKKRGRAKKIMGDHIEVGPESEQNTSFGSETSDEESLGKKPKKSRRKKFPQKLKERPEDVVEEEVGNLRDTKKGGKSEKKRPKVKVDDKEQRTCLHCKEEFETALVMRRHLMSAHHRVWTPANPEGVFNMSRLFRILGKLACLKCGKETRHPQYYKFHADWCGREHETMTCELCGHVIKTMYLSQHMRHSHTPKTPKGKEKQPAKEAVDEEVCLTPLGRVRRKAATKAIDHIKNLDQKDLLQTEEDNVQKYTIVSRVIPSETMAKFKEQLKTDGQAPCCFEGCGVVNSSIIWVSRHYYSCPHAPPEVTGDTYQCTKCDAIFKKKPDIETHVNKHDWAKEYASDTDDSADSDVSDDDMSSGETESDTELPEPNSIKKTGDLRKRKPKPKSAESAGYPTRQLLALSGYSDGHIFPSSFPWTLAWRKKLLSTDVMPEWRPKSGDWTLVDNVAPCLPVSELSPSFRVVQKQKTKVATTRLALFDAVLYGGATFNVGGPIWAAAWCPVPVTAATSHQYLAVYCHRHHDVTHVVERGLDKSKALLQIWDCGTLQEGTISEKPRLYLAVAADYGAIWGLAWCPNGAWDSPDVEPQNGHFPRLGLLALACADGMTHILSIPQPSCPLTDRHPVGKLPVYTVRPCLNLKPTYSPDEVGSQCLCVDWIYEDGRSLIVAGFADGTVALWDLHSRSSLLYTSSPTEGATLRPFENFAAHTAQTTGVKFCPQNRQFLGTCSHDRTMKMWDTNDLQCPINKTICSQMTSLVWPPHWSLVYASGDDCYCFGHNAVHVIDNGYYGLNVRPMTIHNSCIWDVSSCDWVNAVSSVSAVGEVAGIWLPEMVYSYRRLKGFTTRRFFIFKTTLEEHTDNDHHKGTPQSLKEHAGRKSTSVGHDGVNVEMIRCEGSNSKGDDLRTEGGASSSNRESTAGNTNINKSKCTGGFSRTTNTNVAIPTAAGVCNNKTINTDRTKCTPKEHVAKDSEHCGDVCNNSLTETGGCGDDSVEKLACSSDAISGTVMNHSCDKQTVTGGKDSNYCLVYSDLDMAHILEKSQERMSFARDMPRDSLDQPPLLAIHKVCWNPNLGCHLWLAAGGHAGLVRLRHISGLHTKKTSRLMKEFKCNT